MMTYNVELDAALLKGLCNKVDGEEAANIAPALRGYNTGSYPLGWQCQWFPLYNRTLKAEE